MPTVTVVVQKSLPTANTAALVRGFNAGSGTLPVEFPANIEGAEKVVFKIVDVNTNLNEPPHDISTHDTSYITIQKAGGVFVKADSPIDNLSEIAPQSLNAKMFYWYYTAEGVYIQGTNFKFYAIPDKSTITVSAQHCIWLTYATDPATDLPTYHETITYNRPLFLRIPADVAQIIVRPNVNDTWTHNRDDVATLSKYEGRSGTEEATTLADYKDVGGANVITGGTTPPANTPFVLNRLVGLWEYADKTTPTIEIDLGTNATTTLDVPPNTRPIALRLGMHDGYEWTNNNGEVTVTLECTPDTTGSAPKKQGA